MNTRTSNTNGKQCGSGCGCGCGSQCCCDSQSCELECLVRPNFFCGQLLTDADLAAMVAWTRSRLALARFRDGWGIACGLELSCCAPAAAVPYRDDKHAETGLTVYLNAGYALDCCGNDLVVCAPMKVDLAPMCEPPTCAAAAPGAANGGQEDCWTLDDAELMTVQLSLRYDEDLAHGQRAMFRGACSDDGPCQYSRVLEQPSVHLEKIGPGAQVAPDIDADFRQRLRDEVRQIRLAADNIETLLARIGNNPPHQFCFLKDLASCLQKKAAGEPVSALDRLHIAKLMIADWLLRELQCPCDSCPPDNGVPLGRIVLRRRVLASGPQYSVVMIEQRALHRRLLRKDPCRDSDVGKLDLGQYLWQPSELAIGQLRSLGITIPEPPAPTDAPIQLDNEFMAFENAVLSVAPGGSVRAYIVPGFPDGQRIAFFVSV